MKPEINSTSFGSITVDGITYDHDIIIRKSGAIEKRKKKLSKAIYGTSHTVSLDEIKFIFEDGAEGIIIGTGQYGVLKLSDEAVNLLSNRKCSLHMFPTPEAISHWNRQEGSYIGLFHITC